MAQYSTKIEEYCKSNNVNTVNFRSDVLLQSDRDEVVYIYEWNLDIPQPTSEQIESYETVANQTEANVVNAKASGNTKLLDLGLTEEEVKALIGI